MFFKREKSLVDSGIFEGFTDYHSHILPGVDDGVESSREAVKILNWYESLGIKRVIFTPHILEDYTENDATYLRGVFEKFKAQYSGGVELALGAEYMIDSQFEKHLDSGDLLTIKDRHLLVESSYMSTSIHFMDIMRRILSKGYYVVLAHPERYLFLSEEDYSNLKDMGILFQMNLTSILGSYGDEVRKRAKKLLNFSYYDYLGSDIHSFRYHEKVFSSAKVGVKLIDKMKRIKNI